MSKRDFDLVIPVLNEADTLPILFARLQALPIMKSAQVIFVDNGSRDGSLELLKSYPGAQIVEHKNNEGYGASVVDGMAAGTSPFIVILDADCEYPPECIPDLLQSLAKESVVYGSRFLVPESGKDSKMPLLKRVGNRVVSSAFNCIFQQNLTDLYTGCKALRRSCLEGMTLQQRGFEHVLELSAKLSARGHRIHEIPVLFAPRQAGQSKMRHIAETVKFFCWLLQYAYQMKKGALR